MRIEQQFFNKLAAKLEEIFPKTNQDHPEIPSEGNRSGAISLNAFANIYLREALAKQRTQTLQAQKKQIINGIEKIKEKVSATHGTNKYDSCYDDCIEAGVNDKSNLQVLCKKCNNHKNDKIL